jgi:hypothetical protein
MLQLISRPHKELYEEKTLILFVICNYPKFLWWTFCLQKITLLYQNANPNSWLQFATILPTTTHNWQKLSNYLFIFKKGSGIHAYVIRLIRKVTLHSAFGPPFTPYPLFQWYPQSKDILISLSMKCCNLVWNADTQHLMHKVRDTL